ncbi:MAG: sulfotransferase family protein [Granulosicoccus sp.]
MKYLCAGLSKTGTTSVTDAFKLLGFSAIHFDIERMAPFLLHGEELDCSIYDDIDFVSDLPTAYFYKEFIGHNPDLKIILTVRDLDDWWQSIQTHFAARGVDNNYKCRIGHVLNVLGLKNNRLSKRYRERLIKIAIRLRVYKGLEPEEKSFKAAYLEHNQAVMDFVGKENLLILDINDDQKWEKICGFVGTKPPESPFPHSNKAVVRKLRTQPSALS